MRCPLCETVLPGGAKACTYCDWTRGEELLPDEARGTDRDRVAMWLSLCAPGLGHLYKGYVLLGGAIFFVIGPLVLALALVTLPATLGLSLAFPCVFMGLVTLHAFRAPDRREEAIRQARVWDRGARAEH